MIALFTDFGTQDAYVAQLKGAILGIAPTVPLLDLMHEVRPFALRAAAYLLDAAVRYLPAGTIVVAVVDPGVGSARRPILVQTCAGKWYVGPDNGLLTHVLAREQWRAAYHVTQRAYFLPQVSHTFHGRDIFGPVAAHLACGVAPEQFGPQVQDVLQLPYVAPAVVGHTVVGEVVHIDRFGNVVTNIPEAYVRGLGLQHHVVVQLRGHAQTVSVVTTYAAGPPGQLLALIGSNGTFEIALQQGHAASWLAVQLGEQVMLSAPHAPS